MMSKDLNAKLLPTHEGDLDRKNTFSDMQRKNTFSRAFTFDGAVLRSNVTNQFEGITRTFTEVGNYIDPDAKFTNTMISDLNKIADKGNEGDIPFPPGFGRKWKFWKLILLSGVLAMFTGFLCCVFLNIGDEVPKHWATCDYANDVSCGDFYNGEKWWIAVTGGTGFTVGFIRWLFSYPDNLPGIFKEIQTYHVEPKWICLTFIISALSLAGGATLGPEQAMGNVGGGLAYLITEYVDFGDEDYKNLFVLCGMAGPLGALFPTPMLGAMMMHELGNPPGHFMESSIMLSISACVGFAIYYEMVGVTYLEHASSSGAFLAAKWIESGYHSWQILTGIAVGLISAALCFGCVISIGFHKQVFFRIRTRLQEKPFLREIVPPLMGGLIIGAVNWALPLTVGNGNLVFTYLIKAGNNGEVSQKLLVCSGFARMFLLGVSMNCGFVGGIIFPFLTMGYIAGTIMYINYPYVPQGLCLGTFMISIACGIVPMPFTFTALVVFIFYFGLYQTVPIFIASFVSYLAISGSGLMKKMALRGKANNDGEGESQKGSISQPKQVAANKAEADDFALKQYLGNKKNQQETTSGHH